MLDWQEFVASLVSSLAWPVAAVTIALIARKPVLALIERMNEMSGFGLNAKFDAKLAKTTEDVIASQGGVPLENIGAPQGWVELAQRSPRAAILEAWLRLEEALQQKMVAKGWVAPSQKLGPGALLETARREKLIDDKAYQSLKGLQALRNLAVHGPASELTFEKAQEFLMLAEAMELVLRRTGDPAT